ncbi:hypothetical protein B5X24_HaOG204172 [Helicoverpa armigera]|uniref:Uncharacterized protein n=1 Tax=Helicoverpa armigera TaxID=29058 RepID=A0A2W1BP35_HELAM|nr:hypothetical protein B5X24_HaOG204172 [Helicoverpa armigera]
MKTILIIFMFITITTCGVLKDEEKSEISTETQFDNATIVPAIDNNEGSSTTENNETVSESLKGDITQVEDKDTIAAYDAFETKSMIYKEDEEELKKESPNMLLVTSNQNSEIDNYTRYPTTSVFVGSACLPGQGRADDGSCVERV